MFIPLERPNDKLGSYDQKITSSNPTNTSLDLNLSHLISKYDLPVLCDLQIITHEHDVYPVDTEK